ncbi:MAG TPA: hypothetical protein VMI30_11450, partial [Stellaceae bacterium]|nr:hypothetical protein [Stellaceae bacterium]
MDQHSEPAPAKQPAPSASGEVGVRHFREIVLWPIYLSPSEPHADVPDYAQRLLDTAPDGLWQEVADEFTADPAAFQERHYNEFVAFLPAVQRFLYGQGRSAAVKHGYGDSPIRVLRRMDIQQVRVQLGRDDPALLFDVAHVDLYFFFDIDIAVLTLEILADNMTLRTAQEVMFQFGRAYPSFWEEDDTAGHCPWRVEWLGAGGEVLAASDYGDRHKYLAFTAKHRAPCLASHWEYLLRPLALDHTEAQGPLRYRQLEYYRMPLMAFLALDDPGMLGPNEIVQLALANGRTDGIERRGAKKHSAHFETQRSSARFREIRDEENSGTRYLSSGRALV